MKTMRCCVIDDEPLAAGLIARYIEKTSGLEHAGTFYSAQDAVKAVVGGEVDVVFLDINMPQLNGLEFAKIIPSNVCVIFTTAYDNYAVESFRVNAMDYLLKPVSYDLFLEAIEKVRKRFFGQDSGTAINHIIVRSEYKLIQINLNDVLYIEGLKDYVKFVLEGENRSVMTLMNIKDVEQTLSKQNFLRVHRSFIVNTNKIKVIERNRIVFGNTYVPVSDTYRQAFTDYIAERSL